MFQEKKLISSYRRSKRQQWVERGSERTTVCPTWHLRVMEETFKKCNQVLTRKYTLKLQYVRLIKKQCLCLRVSHKSSLLVNRKLVIKKSHIPNQLVVTIFLPEGLWLTDAVLGPGCYSEPQHSSALSIAALSIAVPIRHLCIASCTS